MSNESTKGVAAVILAAGKGTRMHSPTAKVLHLLGNRPIILYPVTLAETLGVQPIVVVVGYQAEQVRTVLGDRPVRIALQSEQSGTAHAVSQSEALLNDFDGTVLILCGDVPLLKPSTAARFIDCHRAGPAVVTVMTTTLDNPKGYGRIVRDRAGRMMKIVEDRDASIAEQSIREINTGIYLVEKTFLFDALRTVGNRNQQREYYLPDIIETAVAAQLPVEACHFPESFETMGINTPQDLERAQDLLADFADDLFGPNFPRNPIN
ncbi:MAG: NTP transferase domain-containing protein [Deltaproteobacteria bacterium]|nr:NTP transferase domain-containing protein [Deltaproteobacteria bacterium]